MIKKQQLNVRLKATNLIGQKEYVRVFRIIYSVVLTLCRLFFGCFWPDFFLPFLGSTILTPSLSKCVSFRIQSEEVVTPTCELKQPS